MYAELFHFMELCCAHQGVEWTVVARCGKDAKETGGPAEVLKVKGEDKDSFSPEAGKSWEDQLDFDDDSKLWKSHNNCVVSHNRVLTSKI